MSGQRSRLLIIAAGLALAVELVGVIGWWSWQNAKHQLEDDPSTGALNLAQDAFLRLPSAIRGSRRLPGRELGRAPGILVAPALVVLSRGQRRWAPADPAGFVNRARARLIEGSMDDAFVDLNEAIVRDPTSPRLHWLTALTERERGRNASALDHLATSEGLGFSNPPLRIELTPEEDEWVRIEGLERRLDLYPRTRSRGIIALARELRARDQAELGREHLRREPDDPRVELELARWDLDDGLTGQAEQRLSDLAARKGLPGSLLAEVWTVAAELRDRIGDVGGAQEAADIALSHDPSSAGPYRVLAGLAERRGDVEGALEQLRRAWGMNPTDIGLLMAVARTAEKAGQQEDARLALERASKVDPTNPGLAAALVEFHLRHGEFMDATVTLSDALDRFPTDPRLLRLAERLRAEVSRR